MVGDVDTSRVVDQAWSEAIIRVLRSRKRREGRIEVEATGMRLGKREV